MGLEQVLRDERAVRDRSSDASAWPTSPRAATPAHEPARSPRRLHVHATCRPGPRRGRPGRAVRPVARRQPVTTAGVPGTPATNALAKAGIAFTEHEYVHDPANRSTAWRRRRRSASTPSRSSRRSSPTSTGSSWSASCPSRASSTLGALAKASVASGRRWPTPALAQRRTGYVLGGISPIGSERRTRRCSDETPTLRHGRHVSGGAAASISASHPHDLIAATERRSRRSPRTDGTHPLHASPRGPPPPDTPLGAAVPLVQCFRVRFRVVPVPPQGRPE